MTEESKRRGRPAKAIIGVETSHENWKHPPLQGHEGETGVELAENPASVLPADINGDAKDNRIEFPAGYFSIENAPKDRRIVVSETGKDQTCVYWRVRRIVDKKNLRYITTGKWTDDLSRLDIDFEPKYWRPYVASDYIPVPRVQ